MKTLVIAEHDNASLKPATLNTVTAAAQCGGDVHVLVAGHNCAEAGAAAAKVKGVAKVLVSDAPQFEGALAENITALVLSVAKSYTHIVAPATGMGKNFMPRVAALLDVQQISDISSVVSADTFVRPTYAGNVMATVQSSDAIKVITVRATAFDPAGDGGSAPVEALAATPAAGLSKFNGQELTKSARPELTAARIIVSGGRGMGSAENFKILEPLAAAHERDRHADDRDDRQRRAKANGRHGERYQDFDQCKAAVLHGLLPGRRTFSVPSVMPSTVKVFSLPSRESTTR